MLMQINADSNIEGDNALAQPVQAVVRGRLAHFGDQITGVDVHLSDENSDKGEGSLQRLGDDAPDATRW